MTELGRSAPRSELTHRAAKTRSESESATAAQIDYEPRFPLGVLDLAIWSE